MPGLQVVLDINVLIAALRSPCGASYRVLGPLERGHFDVHISVPLVQQFERVMAKIAEADLEPLAEDQPPES